MSDINKKESFLSLDIENIFENFIKPGVITREKTVAKGVTVEVKPLNPAELFSAEAEIKANNPRIAPDIIAKLRSASVLSYAVVSLNGVKIEKEGISQDDLIIRRAALYKQLMQTPMYVLQKMYEFYLEVVDEQRKLYENPKELNESLENF